MEKTTTKLNTGRITQVIGPVVDVQFSENLPAIYSALEIKTESSTLVLEVQSQLPGNVVRTVAMASTYGLKRGTEVIDTGKPIRVPVGNITLGRMFDVTGNAIDGRPNVKAEKTYP